MQYSYKKIWTVTYPVLISLLMQNLISLTDTAFMGRVGEVELGASAIAGIYYLVIYMIGFGFSIGAEILMSRLNGEKEYASIGRVFYHGAAALTLMALVMFTVSSVFSPAILGKIISSEQVRQATLEYTRWRVYGFSFSFIAIMFRAYFMATTNTRILTLNSVVMVLSNVALNYILIFGKLGFPALGIAGAAIASSVSELISVVFYVLYTRLGTDYRKYGMFRRSRYSFGMQNRILGVAGWTMIQYFISCGTWLFFFLATEHLGERPLAVSNMVRSISSLLYIFVAAFATTGTALVGNMMGEGKKDMVTALCGKIIRMCGLCTLPVVLLALLFPSPILGIYTDNAELIASSLPSMRVMLMSYLFGVPAYVYFLAISGTGNTRAALRIELACLAAYGLYTYLTAFVYRTDVAVCWGVETVYCFMLLAICRTYLNKGGWRSIKI